MNVSKIGIDRLYNLGNYEHVKYSISVDVKEGESATHALRQLEAIIESLNPRPVGVPTLSEIQQDEARYEREYKMSAAEFERYHSHVEGGPGAYFERVRAGIEEKKQKLSAWKEKMEKCRAAFDNLGGQAVYKDAKLSWEDGYSGD